MVQSGPASTRLRSSTRRPSSGPAGGGVIWLSSGDPGDAGGEDRPHAARDASAERDIVGSRGCLYRQAEPGFHSPGFTTPAPPPPHPPRPFPPPPPTAPSGA